VGYRQEGVLKIKKLVGHVVLCVFATCGIALAQAVSEVQGTVQDGTGAVLPGVDVKMS